MISANEAYDLTCEANNRVTEELLSHQKMIAMTIKDRAKRGFSHCDYVIKRPLKSQIINWLVDYGYKINICDAQTETHLVIYWGLGT